MTTSEGGGVVVPERSAIPIVYMADDPIGVPMPGMPSPALWAAFDHSGRPQWARRTDENIWRLSADGDPNAVLVRLGRDWHR